MDAVHQYHSADIDGHPNPQNDIGINRCISKNEFCGFESMESLNQWFTEEEIIELWWLDFKAVELNDVEITAVGEKQILFIKPEPEKILKKSEILLDIAF